MQVALIQNASNLGAVSCYGKPDPQRRKQLSGMELAPFIPSYLSNQTGELSWQYYADRNNS